MIPAIQLTSFLVLIALLTAWPADAQTITSVNPTAATRSGFVEVLGTDFSATPGTLLIGGVSAPVATWKNDRIAAYVPESVPSGSHMVEVVTVSGTSNSVALAVSDRAPGGRVQWRLRMDSPYSLVRPVRGPDDTIYVVDVSGRLYAVAPDGALKWLVVDGGDKGVAVGADGTVYTGSESDVKAFAPDGTLKWVYVQSPRSYIMLGLAVGPDGNVYGVGTEGPGVFSLTPHGALRWTNPEHYRRAIVDYGEIVFGKNNGSDQLYFYANDHSRAVRLEDGASVFTLPPAGQPVAGPLDGTMHAKGRAYSPDGQLLWSFNFPFSASAVSNPDIGSDGTHYVTWSSQALYAINPDGSEKWHATLSSYLGPPNIDPGNALLVFGSSNYLDQQSFVLGVSTSSHEITWKVDLPAEETFVFNPSTGQFGFNQFIGTRTAFTADGKSVYLATAIASGGLVRDRSFLYALTAKLPNLDVDANSVGEAGYDAATDGLLVLRHMFGMTGTALTGGALGAAATRVDPVAVKAYLDGLGPWLDIDGDGVINPLTDGLLVLRYMAGLRGSTLINRAVAGGAARTAAADIEAWLRELLP